MREFTLAFLGKFRLALTQVHVTGNKGRFKRGAEVPDVEIYWGCEQWTCYIHLEMEDGWDSGGDYPDMGICQLIGPHGFPPRAGERYTWATFSKRDICVIPERCPFVNPLLCVVNRAFYRLYYKQYSWQTLSCIMPYNNSYTATNSFYPKPSN